MLALNDFHGKILHLAKIYLWLRGVLSLALSLHTYINKSHLSDLFLWEIQAKWQARFCKSVTNKSTFTRKAGTTTSIKNYLHYQH